MQTRVRFAPSPTGNVHIGNIRVAIFNWLFARAQQGKFLLRIEDTDLERSTPEAIRNLLNAMAWMGLEYDEEATYQTKNRPFHEEAVAKMIAAGHARAPHGEEPTTLEFHAGLFDASFVSPPREPAMIDVSKGSLSSTRRSLLHRVVSSSGQPFTTPINWDALANLEIELANGTRLPGAETKQRVDAALPDGAGEVDLATLLGSAATALHFTRRYVFFEDKVLGLLEKPLDSLRDLVIVRSDGSPVFHLANVVDDAAMGITHILRGNDHVENTFRHLFIFRALGATPPIYAHFPMIVNQQGKPYSKRDGDAYVGDYRQKGYLPECLFNFLALCGWSPGDGREVMTRAEMIADFTLDRVNKSAAQFNLEKLEWMNGQYLSAAPTESLIPPIREALERNGIGVGAIDGTWLAALVELEKERLRTLDGFLANTHFFWTEEVELDEKAVRKNLLKQEGAGLAALKAARPILAEIETWDLPTLEARMNHYLEECGLSMGSLAQPIRTAVTGTGVSRGIWETLTLLGKERTLARIDRCLATAPSLAVG